MQTLHVDLENCFGIAKLEHTFCFGPHNCILIYAPNGMMKSSFARTFGCVAKGEVPCDHIYTERPTRYSILSDGKDIAPESLYAANAESDQAAENCVTAFLASQELKAQYDAIYQELAAAKSDFLRQLKSLSKSTDCEGEILSTFRTHENDTFFTCLLSIEEHIRQAQHLYPFRYNDIFDKKGKVQAFLSSRKDLIRQYFEDYHQLLRQSDFFQSNDSGSSFGTYQASLLCDSMSDDAFFAARHKIQLKSGIEVTSVQQLQEIIQAELTRIIEQDKLKNTFIKIDNALRNNSELRTFKEVLEKHQEIIPELLDYQGFKRKVWYGYLSHMQDKALSLIDLYRSRQATLEQLITSARLQQTTWRRIIDIYNRRFHVPFEVEIKNMADVVLKQETATLCFKYRDARAQESVEQPKEKLLQVLSRGEQRAFYTLQLLFEIEARKHTQTDNLLILDDIADSFDYKNKYAIIEYLADLCHDTKFKIILLTHNFDFYRTVASRLGLKHKEVFMAIRLTRGQIVLLPGQYRNDVFQYFTKQAARKTIFIGLLPFVRNIIEYTHSQESAPYRCLTSCLHIRPQTATITAEQVCAIYKEHIHGCKELVIDFGAKNILELILEEADKLAARNPQLDEIALENKLVLSIAIRLRAERLILKSLPETDTKAFISRKTHHLIQCYRDSPHARPEVEAVLSKVSLMTPENIHVNTFMYEPLIDMSVLHLVTLYGEVKQCEESLSITG